MCITLSSTLEIHCDMMTGYWCSIFNQEAAEYEASAYYNEHLAVDRKDILILVC